MNLDAFQPGEVPPADEITADFWAATGEHRLTVQSCERCGHVQHPPRALCTACGDTEHLAQVAAAGTGVVDGFTVVHRPPVPTMAAPYTIARVRLDEGPLMLTRLVDEHAAGPNWAVGDPVEVAWVDLPDGRALPYFRPTPTHPDQTTKED